MFINKSIQGLLITCFMLVGMGVNASTVDEKELRSWLNTSVDNHPTVLAAQANLDVLSYQLEAADKALYNPEVEIDTESTAVNTTSIGYTQTIDWSDTRGARTKVAKLEKSAAEYNFESTRRETAVELLSALAEYHSSTSLKALAVRGNELLRRSASLAKKRFEAGDLGKVEVDLANLSYAQARFRLADATSNHARAIQKLIALTGSTIRHWPTLLSKLPNPNSNNQNVDAIIKQLPEMRQILSRVAAAQANIQVQTSQGSVNPTFSVRAGKDGSDSLLGLNLSIPLQVRNNFKAEVNVANAQMIQAEKESIAAFRNLKSRLEISTVTYELSREAWLGWQSSGADSLNEQIKLLERLWEARELSTTDYLLQLTQALDTKASALEQLNQMWTHWTEWLVATGNIQHWLHTGENK